MQFIKSLFCTLTAFFLALIAQGQIRNGSFELQATNAGDPLSAWYAKPVEGYSLSADSTVKHTGNFSLKLASGQTGKTGFMSFSQVVTLKPARLQRVAVNAFIKCTEVKEEATLWCQIWDEKDKKIGFQNLAAQGIKVPGNAGWKKYSMVLTLNSQAKKILLGGYLKGTGTAWFDDFEIEDLNQPDAPADQAVARYIQTFTEIVKDNSIFTDSLDWPSIEKDIHEFSKGLKNIEEARFLADYVIQELRSAGDNHSFIMGKAMSGQYAAKNIDSRKPEARLLPGNIGYINVPGFGSTNYSALKEFAADIQNKIRQLDSTSHIEGWIVDLRQNTGGNMYPMIAGLGPLTGEGTLGYFIKTTGKKKLSSKWYYRNGRIGAGTGTAIKLSAPYTLKNKDTKIAVLIGPKTSSSGEMTTISFIGKKNVKLFGQPSGGYTTANNMYNLSDGSSLLLASSYTADRNRKQYLKKLVPDELVQQTNGGPDADIKAAETWLLATKKLHLVK